MVHSREVSRKPFDRVPFQLYANTSFFFFTASRSGVATDSCVTNGPQQMP